MSVRKSIAQHSVVKKIQELMENGVIAQSYKIINPVTSEI